MNEKRFLESTGHYVPYVASTSAAAGDYAQPTSAAESVPPNFDCQYEELKLSRVYAPSE